MDLSLLTQKSDYAWVIDRRDGMNVPVVIYADRGLIEAMDEKVYQQAVNVARLPGIVGTCCVMPDAHWGYGFPIGGVAAFDASQGGVVSAGGVGFDISCGVRMLRTGLDRKAIESVKTNLADALFSGIPAGLGSRSEIRLNAAEMDAMLAGGARWAVDRGWGRAEDLERIEEQGRMSGADSRAVSARAKDRQRDEMGTLGSGNHYLEIQEVEQVYEPDVAGVFGLRKGEIVISIHCGSRGLGHQIGTEFLKEMVAAAASHHIRLPDRELACAPIDSPVGQRYLGAMRAGINCALANRQIITHSAREVFGRFFPQASMRLVYDVSHNTCKVEQHAVDGNRTSVYVHRKGATRAFGPGHPELPDDFRAVGQPVLIGGSMGTGSHVLCGTAQAERLSFSSACHGAGRAMSRRAATRRWQGRELLRELAQRGIEIRSPSPRGVAEEAPGAYKDVDAVVDAAHHAGIARKVARLTPVICVKG